MNCNDKEIEEFLKSKIRNNILRQNENVSLNELKTESVTIPINLGSKIIVILLFGFLLYLGFKQGELENECYLNKECRELIKQQGSSISSYEVFQVLTILAIILIAIKIFKNRNTGLGLDYSSQKSKFQYLETDVARQLMESTAYQEVLKVFQIVFKEKDLFTKNEIARFIDNENDLFNASYERIKKVRGSYFDQEAFRELILKWSDEYMKGKIESLYTGVPVNESAIVDKYISVFGQFKEYSDIVQASLRLPFHLGPALDRKFESIKTLKNESLLNDILEKGTYDKNQISVTDLDYMDGIEFEVFLSILFRKMGYRAEVTKASGDQGVDLILSDLQFKYAVQAKRYSDKVSNSAIQEVFAGMKFYNCSKAMVVTTNYFTASAVALAQKNGVELIDRDKLNSFLVKHVIYQSDIESVEMKEGDV